MVISQRALLAIYNESPNDSEKFHTCGAANRLTAMSQPLMRGREPMAHRYYTMFWRPGRD